MSRSFRFVRPVLLTVTLSFLFGCGSDSDEKRATADTNERTSIDVRTDVTPTDFMEGILDTDTDSHHNGVDLECWDVNPYLVQSANEQRTTCLYDLEHERDEVQKHRDELAEIPWEEKLRFTRLPSVPTEAALTRLVQISCGMRGDHVAFWNVASSAYLSLIARGELSEQEAVVREWPKTLNGAYNEQCLGSKS
jgi:hypothetical protein